MHKYKSITTIDQYNEYVTLAIKANIEYYYNKNSIMPDWEYDILYKCIEDWEIMYPEQLRKDSPTIHMYLPKDNKLQVVKHYQFMGSLKRIDDEEELIAWIDKHPCKYGYCCEGKYDGLSIEAIYQDNTLIDIILRGDGVNGESVLHNRHVFERSTLPYNLIKHHDGIISIIGEAIMANNLYSQLSTNTKYTNARSAVVGLLRNKSTIKAFKDYVTFIPYGYKTELPLHVTHYDKIQYIKELLNWNITNGVFGLDNEVLYTIEDIQNYYNRTLEYRTYKDYDYNTDGIVIKINDVSQQEVLGYNTKNPNWAIAWKFPPEVLYTYLASVEWTVGKKGHVVPKGHLTDKLNFSGVSVSKIALHSVNYIKSHHLLIGQMLGIGRLKDCVPGIVSFNNDLSLLDGPTLEEISIPTHCPVCNSLLIRKGAHLFCENEKCNAKLA